MATVKLGDLLHHCAIWKTSANNSELSESAIKFFTESGATTVAGYMEKHNRLAAICNATARVLGIAARGEGEALSNTADALQAFTKLFPVLSDAPLPENARGRQQAADAPGNAQPNDEQARERRAAEEEKLRREAAARGDEVDQPDEGGHDNFANPRERMIAAVGRIDEMKETHPRHYKVFRMLLRTIGTIAATLELNQSEENLDEEVEKNVQPLLQDLDTASTHDEEVDHPVAVYDAFRATRDYYSTQSDLQALAWVRALDYALKWVSKSDPLLARVQTPKNAHQVKEAYKSLSIKKLTREHFKWWLDNNVPLPIEFIAIRFIRDQMGSMIAGKRGSDTARLFISEWLAACSGASGCIGLAQSELVWLHACRRRELPAGQHCHPEDALLLRDVLHWLHSHATRQPAGAAKRARARARKRRRCHHVEPER
jgi:hypothetical protein